MPNTVIAVSKTGTLDLSLTIVKGFMINANVAHIMVPSAAPTISILSNYASGKSKKN